MAFFNGNKAYIDGQGNLTLGADLNDPNVDSTHKYAKSDVFTVVPLSEILYAAGDTADFIAPAAANTIARATGAAGSGYAVLDVAQNILGNFLIPLNPPTGFRTLSAANNAQNQSVSMPHGAKLKAVSVAYRILTTDLPAAPTFKVFSKAFPANGAALGSNTDIPVTYTVGGVATAAASLPVTKHATNVNVIRAIVTTPTFNNTLGTGLFAEFQIQPANTGATDRAELVAVMAEWSVALY